MEWIVFKYIRDWSDQVVTRVVKGGMSTEDEAVEYLKGYLVANPNDFPNGVWYEVHRIWR